MPSFRFVHAADLHLDTPFSGIAGPAPHVAEALREASLQAWDDLVRFTISEGAAALLLAGDIYDGEQRGVRAQLRFLRGLRDLSQAGVATFIVHGNHDPIGGWSAIREWPPNVTVFGHERVETVPLLVGGDTVAHIHGISYGRRDVGENLALRFQRSSGPALHIGLLHASVGSVGEHATYAPCSMSDLQDARMDYWALGHVHKREVLRAGDPWVVYPGDLQGRSVKQSETGAKGAYLVDVQGPASSSITPTFHALDRVRFVIHHHDIGPEADLAALQHSLVDAIEARRAQHAGRALLVRVVLEGRGEAAHDLRRTEALSHLETEIREMFAHVTPLLWLESIIDRAAPAIDPSAIRARGEFSAAVLDLAEHLEADQDALAAFLTTRTTLLHTGQVGRQVRELPPDLPTDVLSDAIALVLESLSAAEGP
jgi:DNA repair exonuclease SbcCD nuclease subunit